MTRTIRAGLSLVLLSLTGQSVAQTCRYGPDYCTDDPRIAPLLRQKRSDLAKDYPARLLALLDKGPQCVARIEREPDIFSFVFVYADGRIETHPWSQDDEALAQRQLTSGELKRYWIVNGRRAFSCGGEPNYDAMDDYDSDDDVNASRAIRCVRGSAC